MMLKETRKHAVFIKIRSMASQLVPYHFHEKKAL